MRQRYLIGVFQIDSNRDASCQAAQLDFDAERLGPYGDMLPSLKAKEDQNFLWEHLDDIDIFESDHAPHSKEEKEAGAHGVPGLETTLPLLLTAERDGKITREQIIDKCFTRPAQIFNLPTSNDDYVEVSMEEYVVKNEDLFTKCGWSPWDGVTLYGKVKATYIGGVKVFEDGKILAQPGSGNVIKRENA